MFTQLLIVGLVGVATGLPTSWLPSMNPFSPNGRIVGGKDVTIEEVPYQVSLQIDGFGFCGGSIISAEWVLTAGHCLAYPADWITVRAGTTRKSSGGSLHQVDYTLRHENYRTNGYGVPLNDVALIKLRSPLTLDQSRKAVNLYKQDEESVAGRDATITGWGAKLEGGASSEVLQIAKVPIVTKAWCSSKYSSFGGLPEGQICAAYPNGGTDACQGDSGGPLVIGSRLAGIVSWGNGCARRGYPGVYTEVAHYRDWIKAKTGL